MISATPSAFRKTLFGLIVLNALLLVGMVGQLWFGYIGSRMTSESSKPIATGQAADFDQRFSPQIGAVYTAEQHAAAVERLNDQDALIRNQFSGFKASTSLHTRFGAITSIITLINLVLFIKVRARLPQPQED